MTLVALAALTLSLSGVAHADSPLTSTPFASAYSDVAAVARAQNGPSDEVFADLSNPDVPNDVRAAIVNALGWTFGGQDHSERYVAYLARARNTTEARLRLQDLAAHEVFALGYMAAMDDYSELQPMAVQGELGRLSPTDLMEAARGAAPSDAVVGLVHALVRAQGIMHKRGMNGWCAVWQAVSAQLARLTTLRGAALREIETYMRGYRAHCRR
jgi:hypothetical protein